VKILVTGSIAYDTIMVFPDRFRNHLLADQLHILNVCFLTPEMRREYGGTAGNIGYNLRLLGEQPLVMAAVGEDIAPYLARFEKLGVGTAHLRRVAGQFTAQAFITTDLDDNQITAFHPGAMNRSHETRVKDANGAKLGIVSPDGREGMIQHARQFAEAGIPFIFDPGQGMPLFDGDDLMAFIEQATWVTLNDYEAELMQERTEKSLSELARYVKGLIVTLGARGSCVYTDGRVIEIPVVPVTEVTDPTGCGDAYRAGLLYGLARGMDWETTCRVAALIGAIKIAHHGTQNHRFTPDEFAIRFRDNFGYSL